MLLRQTRCSFVPLSPIVQFIKDWLPGSGAEDYVVSANVTASKPPAANAHPTGASGVAAVAADSLANAGAEAAAKAAAKKRSAAREKWAAQIGLPPAAELEPAPAAAPAAAQPAAKPSEAGGCCSAQPAAPADSGAALDPAQLDKAVAKAEASGKSC